jgi:hypothetical protein
VNVGANQLKESFLDSRRRVDLSPLKSRSLFRKEARDELLGKQLNERSVEARWFNIGEARVTTRLETCQAKWCFGATASLTLALGTVVLTEQFGGIFDEATSPAGNGGETEEQP